MQRTETLKYTKVSGTVRNHLPADVDSNPCASQPDCSTARGIGAGQVCSRVGPPNRRALHPPPAAAGELLRATLFRYRNADVLERRPGFATQLHRSACKNPQILPRLNARSDAGPCAPQRLLTRQAWAARLLRPRAGQPDPEPDAYNPARATARLGRIRPGWRGPPACLIRQTVGCSWVEFTASFSPVQFRVRTP